jgi:hypothetical protein
MDPFAGDENDPPTLHRYFYVAADPTDMIDPSGEDGEMAGISGGNTIAAISIPQFSSSVKAATGETATMWLRSFAPWKWFGPATMFHGDNRSFTTAGDDRSFSPSSVTSRIKSFVYYEESTGAILGSGAKSDASLDRLGRTAVGSPSLSVSSSGPAFTMTVSGSLPLLPHAVSPDIDLQLLFTTGSGPSGQTCYSGDLSGDGFPNAEVFVERKGVRTMLLTWATPGTRQLGPPEYLPGTGHENMGHFFRCF